MFDSITASRHSGMDATPGKYARLSVGFQRYGTGFA